jgi:predicted dehydrogenase
MQTIGVIGAGNWGKNIVRVLNGMDTVRLKYVADRSPAIFAAVRERYPRVEAVDDPRRIFDDPEVDAAFVCTQAVHHYELAKEALLSGKHVFVEKPMTLEVGHALELVALSDELNLRLMVGHLLLYHPGIAAVKSLIDGGEIGEPCFLYSQRLNLGTVRSDENVLYSLAPHDISVMLHLLGAAPSTVSATGRSCLHGGIEDVVFLSMAFPSGATAHVQVSWLDPHKVRRITVVGSRKMVVFDDMEPKDKVRIHDKGFDRIVGPGSSNGILVLRNRGEVVSDIPSGEPLVRECDHFIRCIETGAVPSTDGRNGLLVTRVLEALQRSLKLGGSPVAAG